MRKIIFVNRFFYPDHSATSQILTDLANHLQLQGQQVMVLTSRISCDGRKWGFPAKEIINNIYVHRLWTSRLGRHNLLGKAIDYLSFYISIVPALVRHVKRGDVLVVKTDPPLISIVATPFAKLKGAMLVCWMQDLFPEVATALGVKGVGGYWGKYFRWLRNHFLKKSDKVVVLSEKMQTYLEEEGISSKKITIIHNWANGENIQPIGHIENLLREKLNINGRLVVGYSGNLGRAHQYQAILTVITALKDNPSIYFLFIGGGVKNLKLQKEVEKKQLQNVKFIEYVPEDKLKQALGAIDVHLTSLQPSLESFIVPSKIYGILAAGRPTINIGDKNGSIAQILNEYQCGLTVPENNSDALLQAIHLLQTNVEKRTLMGESSRQAYDEKYNRTTSLSLWSKCLESFSCKK